MSEGNICKIRPEIVFWLMSVCWIAWALPIVLQLSAGPKCTDPGGCTVAGSSSSSSFSSYSAYTSSSSSSSPQTLPPRIFPPILPFPDLPFLFAPLSPAPAPPLRVCGKLTVLLGCCHREGKAASDPQHQPLLSTHFTFTILHTTTTTRAPGIHTIKTTIQNNPK